MNAPMHVSPDVLAVELRHVRETVDRILAISERSASKEEMIKADEQVDRRVTALIERVDAMAETIRALQDANTSTTAVVNLAKWIISIGGLTFVAMAARWWLSLPP